MSKSANPHANKGKRTAAGDDTRKPSAPRKSAAAGGRSATRSAGSSTGRPAAGSRAGSPARRSSDDRSTARPVEARKGWGSLARKGAATVRHGDEMGRKASSREQERAERPPARQDPFEVARIEAPKPKRVAGKAQRDQGWRLPEEALKELRERVTEKRAEKLAKHLKDAARAYAGERWGDVRKAIRPLLNDVPDAPSVQELHGMLLYRTGKWAAAAKELQASHDATNSYDLVPAIMDCHRALKKPAKVAELWEDLRIASPSAEVMAEGRIVMAETIADKGDLKAAIELLDKAPRARQRIQTHHLRTMYALADLYDRAGEVAKARMLFQKVATNDPEMADVLERLEALD